MDNAEQILVVILAATLALFLVLSIVAVIKIIQILNHLKRISQKAEHITDRAEAVSEFLGKTAGPAAVGKLFVNVIEVVRQHKDDKRRKKQ